jgi:hypothetical protein
MIILYFSRLFHIYLCIKNDLGMRIDSHFKVA